MLDQIMQIYKCRFCGPESKSYESRSHLNIHYTHTHRDKPQYECDVCGQVRMTLVDDRQSDY